MKNKILLFGCILCISAWLSSCKREKIKYTSSGMKYVLHSENPGPKAKRGDYITINMTYKTEYDSILFDSGKNKLPMRFQLEKPPFPGSMEDGLTYLAPGDSVTFYISADSMIRKVFAKIAGPDYVRPEFLKSGSLLKFDIKLIQIQNPLDAAQEIYRELDKLAAIEKADIEAYVYNNHVGQLPDSNGIYIIKSKETKGVVADSGKIISVNYTGKFLNGVVFDSNLDSGKPYCFVVGAEEAMKGWDIAFRHLRKGEKATLIIPSRFAFGEEGLRNPMDGSFRIKPNTPLLFEVEVVAVE